MKSVKNKFSTELVRFAQGLREGHGIRMKKGIQKTISVSAACLASFILLTACGAQEAETLPEDAGAVTANEALSLEDVGTIPDVVETVSADAQTVETEETAQMPSEEELISSDITIDFPFPVTQDEVYEDAELILVCVDESLSLIHI